MQKFFESVKSLIFCAPPKSKLEWLTTAYKRSGSSKVVTSNGERRQGTLSHNSVLRYLSTAFDNENYFFLGSIVDRILKNFTVSSTSSDSEMRFDSEDSKINFIRGYEIGAERDVLCEFSQSSSLTSSNDEAAAYADDPLADKEWTSSYQKHVDVDKKLESMKTKRNDLKAT